MQFRGSHLPFTALTGITISTHMTTIAVVRMTPNFDVTNVFIFIISLHGPCRTREILGNRNNHRKKTREGFRNTVHFEDQLTGKSSHQVARAACRTDHVSDRSKWSHRVFRLSVGNGDDGVGRYLEPFLEVVRQAHQEHLGKFLVVMDGGAEIEPGTDGERDAVVTSAHQDSGPGTKLQAPEDILLLDFVGNSAARMDVVGPVDSEATWFPDSSSHLSLDSASDFYFVS
jgi:hypothetical protein